MSCQPSVRSLACRCASLLLLVVGLLVAAVPAWAAGDDGDHAAGNPMKELLWQAVNLAILFAVLFYFARKPLQSFFAGRREQIKGDLDAAAELLAAAEKHYAGWQRKLINLQQELDEIRAGGRRRAEEERDAILADAQTAADRIRREMEAVIEQELRRAQNTLRDEAAVLATEIAERILREQLGGADRDRLLDEFITRIQPANEQAS